MKKIIAITLSFFCAVLAYANIQLNGLFSDNMVLQRNAKCAVFGTADPNEDIKVTFNGQVLKTNADANGNWLVKFKEMPENSKGQTLTVSSKEDKIELNDVLVGDVWLCGGQSNMATPVSGHPLLGKIEKERKYENDNLRLVSVKHTRSKKPNDYYGKWDKLDAGKWSPAKVNSILSFGATGFYFGKHLQENSDIPVGMVMSAIGGTRIQPWLPEECASLMSNEDKANSGGYIPHALYNTMIYPLRNFTFKGIVWWQGESNSMWANSYQKLFEGMITNWRKALGNENMPFINVILSTYRPVDGDVTDEAWAWLRDAQHQAVKNLKNTYEVSSFDIGEMVDIHPQYKELIGERLANLAMSIDAKKPLNGPNFDKVEFKDDKAIVYFKNTKSLILKKLIINKDRNIKWYEDPNAIVIEKDFASGFEICGVDKKFWGASAKIEGNKVALYSPMVKKPIAVRYMWKTTALGNVYGDNALPALPFRTDNFECPDFFGSVASLDASFKDAKGLKLDPMINHGEGNLAVVDIEGEQFLRTKKTKNTPIRMAYFRMPKDIKFDTKGRYNVDIFFLDSEYKRVSVMYDSSDKKFKLGKAKEGSWKTMGTFKMNGSNKLKKVSFNVSDLRLENNMNGGALRIEWVGDAEGDIYGVYINKLK